MPEELGHDLLHRQKINSVLKYTHIKLKKQLRTSLRLKKPTRRLLCQFKLHYGCLTPCLHLKHI